MYYRRPALVLTLLLLVSDFLAKRWVLGNVDEFRRGIPLIDGLLRFTYVRNPGAAFGILEGARWPFVAVSVLAVVGLSYLLLRHELSLRRTIAYSMILAGAAGNLVDRVLYGHVIDFIDVYYGAWHWPTFNIADSAITLGAVLLILDALMGHREAAPKRQ